MCIRDSFSHRAAQNAVPQGLDHFAAFDDGPHQRAIRGAAAVSYTHLRAHETVLDLVCRLLLEQNKVDTQLDLPHYNELVHHIRRPLSTPC